MSKVNQKGSGCSREGKRYELQVYSVVKNCKLNNRQFNTQTKEELGGCKATNDILCSFMEDYDIPIEIKKQNTPDWMQCSIKYDEVNKTWKGGCKNKIPEQSKQIFEDVLSTVTLFNGKIPPFMIREITHAEWLSIKKETDDFNDVYIDCPSSTIKNLYRQKGCYYIQISEKGLYHLGDDICGFNVPEFECDQELRVRTKIHSRKNSKGFCNLSVTISCKPKNIKSLTKSPYSLDSFDTLPENLIFNASKE